MHPTPPESPADQFWQRWQQGPPPDVDDLLAQTGPLPPTELAEVLRIDQRQRWQAGDTVTAEAYLGRYPAVAADAEAALDLIYGEFLLREQHGRPQPVEEFCRRFPAHAATLREQVALHRAMAGAETPTAGAGPSTPGWPGLPGYEVLGELGRGGMGVVYKARQLGLNRVVALKVIRGGGHAGTEELRRFRTEAEAVARLQHPNIVQIHEVGEHDGLPWFSLEYCAGGSLAAHLDGTPWPEPRAADLVKTLANAVHAAHLQGVVHRDLKPANILLQEAESSRQGAKAQSQTPTACASLGALAPWRELFFTPKITDFGLARQLDASVQTQSGAIVGTPSYMAPEQAAGKGKEIGPAADVYALGAILYELLTGRPPFKAETPLETVLQVIAADAVPVRQLRPKVSRDLETVCHKCLEKRPDHRYATAADLAADLGRYLRDEPVVARPPSGLERAARFARRHKAMTAALVALLASVVGTSVGMVQAWAQRDRAVLAEAETRRLLAESYAQAAQLASQRGSWRAVLDNLDAAVAAGYPDTAGLQLQRVRAWYALHDVPRAVAEMTALAARSDLGDLQSTVRLWDADLALARSAEDGRALDKVRAALAAGLPPPEEAYAQGLIAETSPDAVTHFQRAVELDPFHPRANGLLALLLLTLGRFDEARARLRFAATVFPDDPTFPILQAEVYELEGDRAAAKAVLERARPRLGDRLFAAARTLADFTAQFRQLAELIDPDPKLSRAARLAKLAPIVLNGTSVARALEGGDGLLLPVPPVLSRAMQGMAKQGPLILAGGGSGGVNQALDQALRVHPQGMLYYRRGVTLATQQRWAEAEEAFRMAVATPSLIAVRKPALLGAAVAALRLANLQGPTPRAEMKARGLECARQVMALGPLRPDQAALLVPLLLQAGELERARLLVADWERQALDDLEATRARMTVEFRSQAYGPAKAAADKILAKKPRDEEASKVRAATLRE